MIAVYPALFRGSMRLSDRSREPAHTLRFRFDGEPVEARAGETIAAALSAAGIVALRRHPDGGMRGLWCGIGACFECIVTVDGRPGQRACLTKATAGAEIRSTRPDTAGLAPLAAAPAGETPPEHRPDVLIIGAGPAGLTAAQLIARAGPTVLVIDERADPGGQYFKPALRPDHQSAAGDRLRDAVAAAGAEIWSEATAWAAFAPDEIGVFHQGRHHVVRPRRLVLATGAIERPVPIPGWTLPGVMTAGAAQTLARRYGVFPVSRIVIAGNGPLNVQLAADLVRAGVTVAAVIEAAPPPRLRHALGAAIHAPPLMAQGAAQLAALLAARVPVRWGARVVAIQGEARAQSCDVQSARGVHRIAADAIVLGDGFAPSTELARQLGCTHEFAGDHPTTATDRAGRTSIPAVFSIGDGARFGGATVAIHRAHLAAAAILADLEVPPIPTRRAGRSLARAERFQTALWRLFAAPPRGPVADDVIVCRCESITAGRLRDALAAHGADAGTAKRLTRAGMGSCQGRNCAATLARLVAEAGGAQPGPAAFFAPRPPAKPVPLAALAFEQPEWGGHRRSTPPATAPRPPRRGPPEWTLRRTDVLVVGAGVVGACVARELAGRGVEVLVVDRDSPAQQASTANAGSLHAQLLSFDFGAKAQAGGTPAAETLRLGPPGIALWQEIAAAAGTDLDLRITGGLMLAETERDLAFLAEKARLEARYGVTTHVIGAADLHALEPAIAPRMIGAAYCPAEGKINPLTATFAVLDLAGRAGAVFAADAPVRSIERDGAGFRVATPAGEIEARRIVNCAGAWSPRISAMVGRPIPVAGAPLQMLVTEPGPALIRALIAHADRHLTLKQTSAGALLIGGGWSAGLDDATGASRALRWAIEGNAWVACRVLPAAASFNLLRVWAGMNIDIDGAPILGEMPGIPGFYNCVTSNGYTLAPIVARITADLLLTGRSDHAWQPFLLDRF